MELTYGEKAALLELIEPIVEEKGIYSTDPASIPRKLDLKNALEKIRKIEPKPPKK